MKIQWISRDSCIPNILILISSVVGFKLLIGFAAEQSETGKVLIDSKDLACVGILDSSYNGT